MRVTDTHVYFWNGIFSQWYDSPFVNSFGESFHCCEQYMMAYKALLFDDIASYHKIMASSDPKTIKKLGRAIANFNQEEWDREKCSIVTTGNFHKFTQDSELEKILLDTGTKTLVEASPYDRVWGIGLAEDNDDVLDESKWLGENLLGKCLMHVRDYML